jgi:hypothetical protein
VLLVIQSYFAKPTNICDRTYTLAVKRYCKSGPSYPDLEVFLKEWGTPRATLQAMPPTSNTNLASALKHLQPPSTCILRFALAHLARAIALFLTLVVGHGQFTSSRASRDTSPRTICSHLTTCFLNNRPPRSAACRRTSYIRTNSNCSFGSRTADF